MAEVANIVATLQAAADAYYNGGSSRAGSMSDAAFDTLLERLRAMSPNHPFLKSVGAPPPAASAVRLAYAMPSLDKIKPGEERLLRFIEEARRRSVEECVVSEKLDGLSAMWIHEPGTAAASGKLYLRGDGIEGQDIRHILTAGLPGVPRHGSAERLAIRGEILLPRATAEAGQLARSFVNGILHRKDPAPEDVQKLRFVAYELMCPATLSRKEQLQRLRDLGCEVAWHEILPLPLVTEAALCKILQERRKDSVYDTDGLVVAFQAVPKSESTATKAKNPKDCVAFKMPMSDQFAETTVREVQWAPSAQGYLIPKLAFEPVQIGAATIQYCTAHNAKCVQEGKLGPGARILIRRSGDVIPTLDTVLEAAAEPSFPPEGSYRWDATRTHIQVAGDSSSKELQRAKLAHFLKTLELPGSGPATAAALVDAGIVGPKELWTATAEALSSILGPKTGAALWSNYRRAIEKTDELTLMIASSMMPRGVGESKLRALFEVGGSDPRCWKEGVHTVAGWTATSLAAFWPALESYGNWRGEVIAWIPYPVVAAAPVAAAPAVVPQRGVICCTGFRDATLEAKALAAGFRIAPSFTGQVTHLLVADTHSPDRMTEKQKAAAAKGIPILTRSAFLAQYLA